MNDMTNDELDIWIAEHIMGWQWQKLNTGYMPEWDKHPWKDMRVLKPIGDKLYMPASKELPILETMMEIPKYSTELVPAFKVFSQCQRHHVYLEIVAGMPTGYFGHARIWSTLDEQGFSSATVPDLICYMAKWAYDTMGAEGWNDCFNPMYPEIA